MFSRYMVVKNIEIPSERVKVYRKIDEGKNDYEVKKYWRGLLGNLHRQISQNIK